MTDNNVKKLCNYMYSCVRESLKSASFRNLNSCKDNKVVVTDKTTFESDDKDILEVMTIHALNKSTMDLLQGELFIEGKHGKDLYFTPLLYSTASLSREGDKITLSIEDDKSLNIGAISGLLENNEEEIELIISQLNELENPEINLKKVLEGLINMDGLKIVDKKAVILATLPNATAGLLSELKQIAEIYCQEM